MAEQHVDPRRLTGDAAWKAHLNAVQTRNDDARKKAADARLTADVAAVARASRLKGD